MLNHSSARQLLLHFPDVEWEIEDETTNGHRRITVRAKRAAITRDSALDLTRKFADLLRDRIICRRNGFLPGPQTIAIRVVIFQLLLDPPQTKWSLRSYARELKCSPSWLSRIGLEFADEIGMRAQWQRLTSRETYAESATHAHAAHPSDEWTFADRGRKRTSSSAPAPAPRPTPAHTSFNRASSPPALAATG